MSFTHLAGSPQTGGQIIMFLVLMQRVCAAPAMLSAATDAVTKAKLAVAMARAQHALP